MAANKEPRLGDVAARAGVSVATVSRVLNNRGYLSEATRARVMAAIDEVGYQPNEVARSLLSHRTGTVGLIVPSVAIPFFGEVAVHIEDALAQHGLRPLLCNSYGRADRERDLLRSLVGHRVDGIISGAHNDQLAEYATLRRPVVTIDRELAPHIPNVRADNEEGGRLATQLLLDHGARRPVLLTSRSHERNLRERGYRGVLAEAAIEPLVVAVDFNLPEPERTTAIMAALDSVSATMDAVFCTDDLLAATALEWAHRHRRDVPGDVRVVGFDGTATMRRILPGLTTIAQPIADMCSTAVRLLVEQIGQEPGAEPTPVPAIALPVTVVEGRTA
ncbi:transcriptional regulator [Propioniciclava flava]|uniref:Transcriptional regulator n=2 Tax=Propioniciclava flava TaxID=2072026 RepID=A0A4Q2EH19_9ACTN|nr:transcriptional regulator [Propioniciclava flava]